MCGPSEKVNKEVEKLSFFSRSPLCPHRHFGGETLDRGMLTRKQHLYLLATPKGYRYEKGGGKKKCNCGEDEHCNITEKPKTTTRCRSVKCTCCRKPWLEPPQLIFPRCQCECANKPKRPT